MPMWQQVSFAVGMAVILAGIFFVANPSIIKTLDLTVCKAAPPVNCSEDIDPLKLKVIYYLKYNH